MFAKKMLSVILAIACVFSVFCFTASAETENYNENLDFAVWDYLFYAHFLDGYFAEGTSPDAETIDQYMKWDVEFNCEDYCVGEDENMLLIYEIPADVYEDMVFSKFVKTDAIVNELHSSDIYKTDRDEPYYSIIVGGGFGGHMPEYAHQGYTVKDDGTFSAWGYLVEFYREIYDEENGYWDAVQYVPAENEVEGVDYILVAHEDYTYDETTGIYKDTFSYAPARIVGALNAVLEFDGVNFRYVSYEKKNQDLIPSEDDMILHEGAYSAHLAGAYMEMTPDTFPKGTVVTGEEIYEGEIYDRAAAALADVDGEIAGVYEFLAENNGEYVQPNKPITVSFYIPFGYTSDVALYHIADDGTAEEIPLTVDEDYMTATAVLEHFSVYALTGTPITYGDVNGDGKVTLMDASDILKSIARWDVDIEMSAADVNLDEKVNLVDVSLILQYIAKWDVVLGPEIWEEPEVPGFPEIDESWAAPYRDFLSENVDDDAEFGEFTLIFFDSDDIPELAVLNGENVLTLYTLGEDGTVEPLEIANGGYAPTGINASNFFYGVGMSLMIDGGTNDKGTYMYEDASEYGADVCLTMYITDAGNNEALLYMYEPERVVNEGKEYMDQVEGIVLTDEEYAEFAELLMESITDGTFQSIDYEYTFPVDHENIAEVFG